MGKKHVRNRLFKVISDFSESQREKSLQGLKQWDYEPADLQQYGLHEQRQSPLQDLEPWEYAPDSHDKREHPRKDAPVYGIFETVDGTFRASTSNVSVGGIQISPETDLLLNEYIFMTFFHKNFIMPIRTNGKVVRVGSNGVGIQFNQEVPAMASV
jgi:hypothetical protein